MSEDRHAAELARAERFRRVYEEEGGLRDLLERMTAELMEEAAACRFDDTGKLHSLSIGIKSVARLNGAIAAVIAGGKLAIAAQDYADQVARIPASRRRFF